MNNYKKPKLSGRHDQINIKPMGKLLLALVMSYASAVVAATPWNPVGNPAQSSTAAGGIAARALDGNRNGHYPSGSVTHTADGDPYPWWYMDIGLHRNIDMITIFNRTDCCSGRLAGAKIFVSNSPFKSASPAATEANPEVSTYTFPDSAAGQAQVNVPVGRLGRIRIQLPFTPSRHGGETLLLTGRHHVYFAKALRFLNRFFRPLPRIDIISASFASQKIHRNHGKLRTGPTL